ncbi:hypothetical protein GCM10010440_49320 [Kitasatospora cinereorecta]
MVLWSLVLIGLLTVLPCAGTARALSGPHPTPAAHTAGPAAATAHHRTTAVTVESRDGIPYVWCAAEGERPMPGNGCSSHAFCAPESQLPNAPPQPAAAVLPRLVAPAALPQCTPPGALVGTDHAPDIHVLQVHRS